MTARDYITGRPRAKIFFRAQGRAAALARAARRKLSSGVANV
jgi:recombinational DNA repair protein (RecF pathway)